MKEEGYTQVEKTANGGKKTITFEQKIYTTKFSGGDSQQMDDVYDSSVKDYKPSQYNTNQYNQLQYQN